jgi:hypothetical protein
VGKKATNIASRGELRKFPLLINIYKQLFNYIIHLNSLPDATIAKQAFLISKELYSNSKPSFYGNSMAILKSYSCHTQIIDEGAITIQSLDFIISNISIIT